MVIFLLIITLSFFSAVSTKVTAFSPCFILNSGVLSDEVKVEEIPLTVDITADSKNLEENLHIEVITKLILFLENEKTNNSQKRHVFIEWFVLLKLEDAIHNDFFIFNNENEWFITHRMILKVKEIQFTSNWIEKYFEKTLVFSSDITKFLVERTARLISAKLMYVYSTEIYFPMALEAAKSGKSIIDEIKEFENKYCEGKTIVEYVSSLSETSQISKEANELIKLNFCKVYVKFPVITEAKVSANVETFFIEKTEDITKFHALIVKELKATTKKLMSHNCVYYCLFIELTQKESEDYGFFYLNDCSNSNSWYLTHSDLYPNEPYDFENFSNTELGLIFNINDVSNFEELHFNEIKLKLIEIYNAQKEARELKQLEIESEIAIAQLLAEDNSRLKASNKQGKKQGNKRTGKKK